MQYVDAHKIYAVCFGPIVSVDMWDFAAAFPDRGFG